MSDAPQQVYSPQHTLAEAIRQESDDTLVFLRPDDSMCRTIFKHSTPYYDAVVMVRITAKDGRNG